MGELRKIPNVGKQTEQDLIRMGYTTIQSLRGKSADELYAEECASRGCVVDRCQLYLYRAVEYFVNTENPDPRKCKWWYWKDDYVEVSPERKDPTISDEQNLANLEKMVANLKKVAGKEE